MLTTIDVQGYWVTLSFEEKTVRIGLDEFYQGLGWLVSSKWGNTYLWSRGDDYYSLDGSVVEKMPFFDADEQPWKVGKKIAEIMAADTQPDLPIVEG